MNTRAVVVGVALAAASFAAGTFIGRRIGARRDGPAIAPAKPSPRITSSSSLPSQPSSSPLPKGAGPAQEQKSTLTNLEVMLRTVRSGTDFAALNRIASTLEPTEIAAALNLAANTSNPQAKATVIQQLIARWAQTDPRAAMAYAQSIRNSQLRNQASLQVLGQWAAADPDAATNWVRQLPRSEEHTSELQS